MPETGFRELQRIAAYNACSVCGGPLTVACIEGRFGLRCGNDKAHQGHRKIKSLTQMYDEGEAVPISVANNIERKRRKQAMAQDTRLARYQGITSLTKADAEVVLRTIWPKAPGQEVLKAALVCRDYGLNPLMKHVFLIPFKEKSGQENYVMVLGIKAKRLIASREGSYNYADGPRIMTDAEQKAIRGEVDETNWWAITVVERGGSRYPGYGSWPRDKTKAPYGAEKGNTAQNMAHIRSESAALERLAPGGFPQMDVVDEAYVDTSARVLETPSGPPSARLAGRGGDSPQDPSPRPGADPSTTDRGREGLRPKPPVSEPKSETVPMPVITNWGDLFTWATKKRDQGGLGYANREAVAVALGFKTADALYKSQKLLVDCVAELLKLATRPDWAEVGKGE